MRKLVQEAMESAIELVVPMEVEVKIADNWLDAH
jgi:DNA polymerase I-like protein with 3'-5' exonuclease and polymerase domains